MGGYRAEARVSDDFDIQPLASARQSPYIPRLKSNGKEVVITVIRPDILPVIQADLKLIYRLARCVPRLPDGRRSRPTEVVREYEKTLIDELNSSCGITTRFSYAILVRPMLYIPIKFDYRSQNMMVMERYMAHSGFDVAALKKNGTNMKLLAERGVKVLSPVFSATAFPCDMHPGNILSAMNTLKIRNISALTGGNVGSLNKEDKRYLVGLIAFLIAITERWQKSECRFSWVPPDNFNVEDFEFAIRTVCKPF